MAAAGVHGPERMRRLSTSSAGSGSDRGDAPRGWRPGGGRGGGRGDLFGRGRGRGRGAYKPTEQATDLFERADSPDRKPLPQRQPAAELRSRLGTADAASTTAGRQQQQQQRRQEQQAEQGQQQQGQQQQQQEQREAQGATEPAAATAAPAAPKANGVAGSSSSSSSSSASGGSDANGDAAAEAPGTAPEPPPSPAVATAAPKPAAALPALPTGLAPDVADALRALCAAAVGGARGDGGIAPLRLAPRGLTNTGNSCFVNCTLQVLLASSSFCGLLHALSKARPALDPATTPMLHALALFGSQLEPLTPAPAGGAAGPASKGDAAAGATAPAKGTAAGAAGTAGKRGTGAAPGPGPTKGPLQTEAAALQLGGGALTPAMFNDVVVRFSPRRAAVAAAAAAAAAAGGGGGRLTMAQRLSAASGGGAEQEQEDAQEFLQHIVDRAHEELVALAGAHHAAQQQGGGGGGGGGGGSDEEEGGPAGAREQAQGGSAEEEEWSQVVGRRGKVGTVRGREDLGGSSVVAAAFRGSFKSCVRARAPGASKPSITLQPFYMLHLDIQHPGVRSVEDALDVLTAGEHLSGAARARRGCGAGRASLGGRARAASSARDPAGRPPHSLAADAPCCRHCSIPPPTPQTTRSRARPRRWRRRRPRVCTSCRRCGRFGPRLRLRKGCQHPGACFAALGASRGTPDP
jgi:hypothetical protein